MTGERDSETMKNRKFSVPDITAIAAFAIVLGISVFWGMKGQGHISGRISGEMAADPGIDNAGGGRMADGAGSEDGAGGVGRAGSGDGMGGSGSRARADGVPVLDQDQDALAGDIMKALNEGNLEKAAGIMEREEETLQDLFYTTMEGRRYLYNGEGLSEEIEGQGMVFTMAGTVYYGTFQDGKPEGQCTALQVVNLDAPRYDYSEGLWKDGRMEGKGHTGYCYYQWSPEGEVRDICKTGTFSEDLMDGEVTYTSMNDENETVTWKLEVDRGVVVTDERWVYSESTEEYQLLSEDSDNHAYVLGEEQIKLPVWKNLLVWEE